MKNSSAVSPFPGTRSSAIIYSIIETAKENNLKPYNYLMYLFEQLPNIDTADISVINRLLPRSDTLPEECRLSAKINDASPDN